MAEFRKLIITTAGFDFLTQAVKDNTAIAFSGVVLAAQNYTDEEIAALTALTDPMQKITNLGIVKPSPETIQITATVSNRATETGYSYSSIGLFAKNANDEEVLFAVSGSNSPGVIPPNTSLFSARLELLLTVSNAEQITFMVDDKIISGTHGIYVGGGDMPEGYDVQIDPEGEALLLDNAMSDTSENVPKTKVVKAYVDGTTAALSAKMSAELQEVDLTAADAARIGAAVQAAFDAFAKESTEYSGCYYREISDGIVEWLNPPMMAGKEYRTVERHRSKPVYVQEFAVGALPNATYKTYNTYVGNVDRILSANLAVQDASSGRTYAYASVDVKCYVGEDGSDYMYVSIDAPNDSSGNNGFVTVKYTKTTD